MTPNNQHQKLAELSAHYRKQKIDFLDSLQPTDFRNGGNFNQAETIIDDLNKALYHTVVNKKDPREFIQKAVTHLFRENSAAMAKAINLANAYLDTF